jgi:hypothetical protein
VVRQCGRTLRGPPTIREKMLQGGAKMIGRHPRNSWMERFLIPEKGTPHRGTCISPSGPSSAADRKAFVELAFCLNADDPNWVPPLKQEVHGLITPRKNPWFEHAEAQLFVAERDGCALLFACWLVLSHDHRTACPATKKPMPLLPKRSRPSHSRSP